MSRYYNIEIDPTANSASGFTAPVLTFSSFPNGIYDPGALQVEFDFLSFASGQPGGLSLVTVHGIPLSLMQNTQNYVGRAITVKAGMQAGLPLANPAQAGTILQGAIFQAFGNWVGDDMALSFVVNPSGLYTYAQPANLVLNWPKGTQLKAALATCLNTAYPTLSQNLNISDTLYTLSHDVLAYYKSLEQLRKMVKSITKPILSPGVDLTITNNVVVGSDGTNPANIITLAFTDLIGQPTWVESYTMQVMTVMRADIQVNSIITFPQGLQDLPGITTTTSAALGSYSALKYKVAFQGNFVVTAVRHVGNYRDSNGTSWASIFQCVPQKVPA